MSGSAGGQPPPTGWGGVSQLHDGERWRAVAAAATVDVPTLGAACVALRSEFEALDLLTSLRVLAALAEGGHAFARLVQADHEAVLLLRAAGVTVPDEVVALFPHEPGAVRARPAAGGGWLLEGRQRRSVHPGAVDAVVVVAATDDGDRPFLVRVDAPGVVRDTTPLSVIAPDDPNRAVSLRAVPAVPVATAAWWAARRPTSDGLLRDAACWFGACGWLCRAVEVLLATRTDPADRARVGRLDVWMHAARLAQRAAVPETVADPSGPRAELAARRAVGTVVTAADTVIRVVAQLSDGRVGGLDPQLPGRVAQLQIALRRFDVEENLRAIGALVAAGVRADPLEA